MPRSSRSSGRPTASSSKPSFNPSGTRSAHTQATPPPFTQQHQPQPQPQYAPQSSGGGFMSNVMSTAAGVGMGSVVGHGVSNMLFGGSSHSAPAEQPQQPVQQQQQQESQKPSCEVQAKDFTRCLEATNDLNTCSYYLDALKACQAAAAPY